MFEICRPTIFAKRIVRILLQEASEDRVYNVHLRLPVSSHKYRVYNVHLRLPVSSPKYLSLVNT